MFFWYLFIEKKIEKGFIEIYFSIFILLYFLNLEGIYLGDFFKLIKFKLTLFVSSFG